MNPSLQTIDFVCNVLCTTSSAYRRVRVISGLFFLLVSRLGFYVHMTGRRLIAKLIRIDILRV